MPEADLTPKADPMDASGGKNTLIQSYLLTGQAETNVKLRIIN
jgi:hypothetical protein